ncbi:MAG TPA: PrgI family protein [Ignavibacteria bacterium]|nr:PrgI family protein [Ignavibacteria bacterium]
MQFQVPQFIEIEDKIFGPLTFKQFVYLAGGAALSFILYKILPSFFAILLIIPVGAFSLALAFYKVNNKSFISITESAIKYALGSKLYIWKKKEFDAKSGAKIEEKKEPINLYVPRLSDSKLKELSWALDVHKKI